MSKPILPFCLAVIALAFLSSCKSFKEPEFIGIENVRVGEIGLNSSQLKLDLRYSNPNKAGLQLKYAEGDAWLDKTLLGHFIVDTLIHIPPNTDFFLPVALKVDMIHIFQNALLAYVNKEVVVKIEGKAKVGKGGIFIHYPIHYEGKQDISKLLKFQ